ncbi:interferon-inducible GTPase 5-like [Crotalus adamanteus]|uniref:Interferon-inducible GTPase 5-like n=1 Tax=Crotalus adamanteus TaxID=8729 RepID=A0AAW1AZ89_CROAD
MGSRDPIIREYEVLKSNSQEKLNEVKYRPLTIAVTGLAGAGKSSFVNAFRDVSDENEEAAKVGPEEKTLEPKAYRHPFIAKITIWDLPEIGTCNFNAEKYLNEVQINKYDVFVIVTSRCFLENEALLAKEIKRKGKMVYYVRTKIDVYIEGARRERNFNEERTLARIKKYCEDGLRGAGDRYARVFLISNHYMHLYDFPTLKHKITAKHPEQKKLVLKLVLQIFSEENLKQKNGKMKARINRDAFVSGTIGAVPIPGPSLLSDIGILLNALRRIRNEFGLNERTLRFLALETEKEYEALRSAVRRTPLVINRELVLFHLSKSSVWMVMSAVELAFDLIPVVGSVFGGVSSFGVTYHFLNKFLDDAMKDAQNVRAKLEESDFQDTPSPS